jgi:prepilin-type N-terminal cleavage/methylation domain-containing protein
VSRRGFTLVELIAVIVVLAVLAAVAVPRYFDYRERAMASQAMGMRKALQDAVRAKQYSGVGLNQFGWPSDVNDILATVSGRGQNPWLPNSLALMADTEDRVTKWHPRVKIIEDRTVDDTSGWYNPANGMVRLWTPRQSTTQATIDLYNLVNSSEITSLSQTTQ